MSLMMLMMCWMLFADRTRCRVLTLISWRRRNSGRRCSWSFSGRCCWYSWDVARVLATTSCVFRWRSASALRRWFGRLDTWVVATSTQLLRPASWWHENSISFGIRYYSQSWFFQAPQSKTNKQNHIILRQGDRHGTTVTKETVHIKKWLKNGKWLPILWSVGKRQHSVSFVYRSYHLPMPDPSPSTRTV